MISEFLCNTFGVLCPNETESIDIIDWTDKLNNYNERIRFLVLHHTVTDSAEATLNAFEENGLSTHYIVDTDAKIYRLVEDQKRAWHAGVSDWANRSNLNDTSIGIEIVNMGDQPFPKEQVEAVAQLSKQIINDYDITKNNIVAHADIAPNRKFDPSGYFDWEIFYKSLGIFDGLYESHLTPEQQKEVLLDWNSSKDAKEEIYNLQNMLLGYGYKIEKTGEYDTQTRNVVQAFNRHFSPEIFVKESIADEKVILNEANQKWYGISKERLDFLLKPE